MTRLRSLLLALVLALLSTPSVDAQKAVHVKPYTRKDGTPVKGYDRRAPTKKGAAPTTTSDPAEADTAAESSTETSEAGLAELADPTRALLSGPSSQLLGFTGARVREALGVPSLVSNGAWNYDSGRQTLHIYFKAGVVSEVRPTNVDLRAFAHLAAPPATIVSPSQKNAPPSPPEEAVAECGDGLFVYVATGTKTYANHGGVAKWLKTPR